LAESWTAHNTGRNVRIEQCPGQRKTGHRSTKALGKLRELLDFLNLLFAFGRSQGLDVRRHHFLVGRISRILGDAVVVFTSQKTRVERRPDGAGLSAETPS
jgi:hypothetical protein